MFDIEKSLNEIEIINVEPSEDLINNTKRRCRQNLKQSKTKTEKKGTNFSKFATAFAAVLMIGIMIGVAIPLFTSNGVVTATSFYTVDINPSVCIFVDDDDVVTEVVSQNDDAKQLADKLDCTGLQILEAIERIVAAADEAGFISSEDAYVLIGYFGDSSETDIDNLQAELEASMGDMINLLVVSGTIDDKLSADSQNVSAGLLLLSRIVDGIDMTGNKKVTEIVKEIENSGETDAIKDIGYDSSDLKSSNISGYLSDNKVKLSWDKITDPEFDGYKIMYSFSDSTPVYGESGCYYAQFITNPSTTSGSYNITGLRGYTDGAKCYFSITALYSDHRILKTGNSISVVLNYSEPNTPLEPAEPASGQATTISGSMSGDIVNLSWDKITAEGFEGYKVMYSFSDSTPVYGESGCYYAKFITNADTTSKSFDVTKFNDYSPNATCYFSITALYDGHSVKKTGNTILLTMPDTVVLEPPRISTDISGNLVGNIINLSWDEIDKLVHTDLDGYKVMYSFSDSTPVYGESGCYYAQWITNSTTISGSYDVTGFNDYVSGATCYFSITALYDGHSVKKTGSVTSIVVP